LQRIARRLHPLDLTSMLLVHNAAPRVQLFDPHLQLIALCIRCRCPRSIYLSLEHIDLRLQH